MTARTENEVLVGVSVNAEIIPRYDRMSTLEKGNLEGLDVDLCGTSANVARAIGKLGQKSRVLALIGVNKDFQTIALKYALEKYAIEHNEFPILNYSHVSVNPIDGLPSKVFGMKGDINQELIAETVEAIEKEISLWRVGTGVRSEELPFVKALFNKHNGYRSLNPRAGLIENREAFLDLLSSTDLLIMNDAEYDACKTTGVSDLHQYGPTLVIVTSDKHGGMFSKSGSKPERFEACTDYLLPPSTKVHTVGAGDWFHAAFIVRCIELGKSICSLTIEEVHDCIKFAARVSGKKVTMQGAANGPSQSDL